MENIHNDANKILLSDGHENISLLVIKKYLEHGLNLEKLKNIQKKINIIYPWDTKYNDLRLNINKRFQVFPWMIAMPKNAEEVVYILKFAKRYSISFSIRAGGHSYEGFSLMEGVVIDMRNMTKIEVDVKNNIVKVESGVRIGRLAKYLSKYDLALPAGTCASVGISGLTLGGGIGFLTRKFGLTLDNLKSIDIILADGELITADINNHADLFWANRGGGGGNFGIVTSLTFQVYKIKKVIIFELTYNFDEMLEIVPLWQKWAPFTDKNLTAELDIYSPAKPVLITGQYLGTEDDLIKLLKPILIIKPKNIKIWQSSFLDAVTNFSIGLVRPPFFKQKSNFIRDIFPKKALKIIHYFMSKAGPFDKLEFNAFGGKVTEISDKDTAFSYRQGILHWMQFSTYWENNTDNPEGKYSKASPEHHLTWIRTFYNKMKSYMSNECYVNCPDTDLQDYLNAYYGQNLKRLVKIKTKYDPFNLFKFEQSIPISKN